MKSCSCCGHESSDDAAYCPACGKEFKTLKTLTEESPGGPFRRPPRPEAASIVLRTFPHETPAQQAVEILRAARIEASIATDDCGGLYPPLGGGSPFRLIISEVHREAAQQVLADMEGNSAAALQRLTALDSTKPVESSKPPALPSTIRSLVPFILGIIAGTLLMFGYQRSQESFTGTVQRDFNHDGRTDAWDTYVKGQWSKMAIDSNGDEQPDVWYYYEDGVTTRWEGDFNFDGRIDLWGNCDGRGVASQSKVDLDYDGKPDVTNFFQSGNFKESHFILPDSGLVWKKSFFTNGILREELLDRDRDGKFDEKLSFDVFGVEVNKEKLK